jgi:hypothetical protein
MTTRPRVTALLVLSSAVLLRNPTFTAAERSPASLPFRDDFSDPSSGWPTGDSNKALMEYLNGSYHVRVKLTSSTQLAKAPALIGPLDDYVAEVDAWLEQDSIAAYGLAFGVQDGPAGLSGHELFVSPREGLYGINTFSPQGAGWTLPLTPSAAVNRGSALNRLRIERRGTEVALFVNGTHLVTRALSGPLGERLGLMLHTSNASRVPADSYFDNFMVDALVPTTETATPPSSPTPTASATLPAGRTELFRDDFSDPLSGWGGADPPRTMVDYVSGELQVRVANRRAIAVVTNLLVPPVTDMYAVEIDGRLAEGSSPGTFGIMVNVQPAADVTTGIEVSVDPAAGTYAITQVIDGERRLIQAANLIRMNPVGAANNLRVERTDGEYVFLLNRREVTRFALADVAGRDFRLVAGGGETSDTVEAYFDNFLLEALPRPTARPPSPTPNPTAVVEWVELLADDFTDPDSGWPAQRDAFLDVGYDAGEYHMQVNQAGRGWYATSFSTLVTDFKAEIDVVVPGSLAAGDEVGLAFAIRDPGTLHYLAFNVRTGEYSVFKVADEYFQLVPWTRSPAINTGTASNRVGVSRLGSRVSFTINDSHLRTLTLPALGPGLVGFWVFMGDSPGPVRAHFDNFWLGVPAAVPTPSPGASATATAFASVPATPPAPETPTPSATPVVTMPSPPARRARILLPALAGARLAKPFAPFGEVVVASQRDSAGTLLDPGTSFPFGTTNLIARLRYGGVPIGTEISWEWWHNGTRIPVPGVFGSFRSSDPTGTVDMVLAAATGAVPRGDYTFRAYYGPGGARGPELASAQVSVSGPGADGGPCRQAVTNGDFESGPRSWVLTSNREPTPALERVVTWAEVAWPGLAPAGGLFLAKLGGSGGLVESLESEPILTAQAADLVSATLRLSVLLLTEEADDEPPGDSLTIYLVSAEDPSRRVVLDSLNRASLRQGRWRTVVSGVPVTRSPGWSSVRLGIEHRANHDAKATFHFVDDIALTMCGVWREQVRFVGALDTF